MLGATAVQDDDCASIVPPSEASGSSSTNSRTKRNSRIGSVFRAFRFHLVIKTDLRDGTTATEKEKLLTEHLRARTGHTQPLCITGLAVFCDRSLFSQPPDSDGLVSIEVLGYVQANNATPLSTVKKWIDSATWKPVEGGLTIDNEYMLNIRGVMKTTAIADNCVAKWMVFLRDGILAIIYRNTNWSRCVQNVGPS
jgi:hypothetical protein